MSRDLILFVFFIPLVLIYANNCGKLCGLNESNDICGKMCEPSCKLRDFSAVQCLQCSEQTRDCRCNQNYLRDEKTGFCVNPEDCTVCDEGESRLACGRKCEGNCTHPYVPEMCSRIRCSKAGCRCDFDKGYVRDTESGQCTAISNCACNYMDKCINLMTNKKYN